MSAPSPTRGAPPAGRYLTFRLGNEQYGVGIMSVREIIEPAQVTRVPDSRAAVRGVINLRGRVVPLIDLKIEFGQGRTEASELTVIIVVQSGDRSFGVLADEVIEVVEFAADHLGPPPIVTDDGRTGRFLLGTGRQSEQLVFLLDLAEAIGPVAAAA